jgi:hypothetical protein
MTVFGTALTALPKTNLLICLTFPFDGGAPERGSCADTKLQIGGWGSTKRYFSSENQPSSMSWSYRHGSKINGLLVRPRW